MRNATHYPCRDTAYFVEEKNGVFTAHGPSGLIGSSPYYGAATMLAIGQRARDNGAEIITCIPASN
jgi:hypothetical protein